MAATVETQDLMPVHSRVSWSAIFAGTVVTLACYLLLSMLGVALGLSISNQVDSNQLGIGATVWAIVTTLLALFIGGYTTSQCTVGENKTEAVVYGIIMWGTVFALLLWLMASGVRVGFNAVIGVASSPAADRAVDRAANLTEDDLRAAGFTDEQIRDLRGQFDRLQTRVQNIPAEMQTVARDPRTTAAAWWTFGGLLLSMLAAIGGSLVGSGPNILLSGLGLRTIVMDTNRPTHQPVGR